MSHRVNQVSVAVVTSSLARVGQEPMHPAARLWRPTANPTTSTAFPAVVDCPAAGMSYLSTFSRCRCCSHQLCAILLSGAGYNGGGGGVSGGGGSSFVNYPSKEAEKPHAVRGSERRRNGAYEVDACFNDLQGV